jgi:hypothetical protein
LSKSSIRKAILQVLDQIEKEFSYNLTLVEKENLIKKHIPTLRKQQTFTLRVALLHVKECFFEYTSEERQDKTQLELVYFQQRLLEEAIESRREQSKKLKVERNYAEAPLFSVSSPSAQQLIELRNDNGEIIERRMGYRKIEYKSKYGKYLTSGDFRIFSGLQRLWEVKGGEKEFSFRFQELCDVIDVTAEGGNYEWISESLIKLSTTSIMMEDFEDASLKKRVRTRVHNVIQSADIDRKNCMANIVFNDYLHKGLKDNNVVSLNLSIFHDLSSVTAKLLYPLLSSLLQERKIIDLNILIDSLGIRNSDRKAVLKGIRIALDDLEQSDVIQSYNLIKKGRSYAAVEITPTPQLIEALVEGITVTQ